MKILALDTSSDACSAAVLTDTTSAVEFELTPRAHTRLILPMIESVLRQTGIALAELDAIAFGRGPGAFTGVRIATGVAQGLAFAANKPVIPVSTLAAVAQQIYQQHAAQQVLVALDARMGEIYWGAYQAHEGSMHLVGEEMVLVPQEVIVPTQAGVWSGGGSGWAVYSAALTAALQAQAVSIGDLYPETLPSAAFIAQLAQVAWQQGLAIPAEQAQPVYLRNKVAQTTLERAGLSG